MVWVSVHTDLSKSIEAPNPLFYHHDPHEHNFYKQNSCLNSPWGFGRSNPSTQHIGHDASTCESHHRFVAPEMIHRCWLSHSGGGLHSCTVAHGSTGDKGRCWPSFLHGMGFLRSQQLGRQQSNWGRLGGFATTSVFVMGKQKVPKKMDRLPGAWNLACLSE